MDTAHRSARSVPMVNVDAMSAAASFVSREWGDNRRIGFAGVVLHDDREVFVFQCAASDGSRWLVFSDRWGNVGTFSPEREQEVGIGLDVEIN